MSTVPTHKDELVIAIKRSFNEFMLACEDIPIALTTTYSMEGHAKGTKMSVNNLLAYLIGWGNLLLKWEKLRAANLPVHFPEVGYKWNELGRLAQKFYAEYADEDFYVLQKRLAMVVEDILALIARKSNSELYHTEWYGKWTQGRMIQFNTSSPYKNARARLRKWKKSL